MAYWHISNWMKLLYPDVVWDIRGTEKTLYFTFDDGPTPEVTHQVLDILDSYNAKGTFFCLGRNVERYPEVYQEVLQRGHQVGNHSYSHLKGWKVPNNEYYGDIELASYFIKSKLFRPPYGQIRRRQAKYLKDYYKVVLWEVMSHDYNQRISKERSLKALLRYTKPGSILVFHDSVKAWPKLEWILPRILDHYTKLGYKFKALSF